MSFALPPFTVAPQEAGFTLAKVLRSRLGGPSWTDVRKLIAARRVKVGDAICSDEARRVKEDEVVVLLEHPKPLPRAAHPERLVVRHLDEHVVVVEKPAGVNTVRHPAELEWSEQRRELDPTLQDLAQWAIAHQLNRAPRDLNGLRIVHRLDKETSGLVVFARSVLAERELGLQFRKHTVVRRYLTVVPGILSAQTIRSRLVEDRGDGRRGSTKLTGVGKEAVTHIALEERLPGYTLLSCRLETGRTHQIRIHLSEAGHPVCGDKVYVKRPNGEVFDDKSEAPRLALHATELGFEHPATNEHLHWSMPLPGDLQKFVEKLRGKA
ncbi:ribosomal large subunit pseudouridine synthase d : Pseudouridine synthase OS=Pirellula staleyi (strain ATCC 27377 / DSM 6068 / ICPB 4128) GN=Psta_0906 PE=3 SV=1: PseudoU_synth_2 [Gemmata massiliana]|uniref:Pseudouridine synthase n=1 Tax=Gemmata massiliana TaxID=1210884 RepID=A0A6P2CZD6_9BACT|nr:RluA family pseudouridine synthase [Gemmata massiliana]VTR93495.1 ribosomal large subunit pseudouridine synthase d : Pseudouridine synthase OS=Pirellula staleyi (strain ATCC 27377 / DSM 6068 / ICPB 4128) GN=Psta_0906 PE=3 SV=1: PseudoU_synth_2 [Gemmata massiliana]